MIKVEVEGMDVGRIIYPPYRLKVEGLDKGTHKVDITLFTNRGNSFSPLHLADTKMKWIGADSRRTSGDKWSYEYNLKPVGLMTSPEIRLIK